MTVKRRTNATGRSLAAKDLMQSTGVWDQRWASFGLDLLESYAWRAASGNARKVVDRIVIEHLRHGSLENGDLPVTYDDSVAYGLRRHSVRQALEEAAALGLIDIILGVRGWGGFRGKPSRYRLTWFGTKDGASPTNRWKRFASVEEAKAAAKASRDSIDASRRRLKRRLTLPNSPADSVCGRGAKNHFSSVESGTVSGVESDTGSLGLKDMECPAFSSVDSGTSLYIYPGDTTLESRSEDEAEQSAAMRDQISQPAE